MNCARRYLGISSDEHVVFHEVTARCVEQRSAVGDGFADDAVARLGDNDVGGAHEVLVAQSVVVDLLL